MRIPLEISFKNLDPSPAIEARIREKADKLDRFYQHIMRCRVTVEVPHPPSSPGPALRGERGHHRTQG
jgi:ribosome-associated translation inhibitor RaiA